ncbi:ion channel, partial [Terrisporobacter muris]
LERRCMKSNDKLNDLKIGYRDDNKYKISEIYGENKEVLDIDEVKYLFTHVENKTIGTKSLDSKHIYKNISNKKIDYNKFIDCNFNNIKFENCTFFGSIFENCKFNNVQFSHCNFEDEEKIIVLFKENCVFERCNFYKTNMKNIVFESVKFTEVKISLSSIRNSIFNQCFIDSIIFSDCDLKSMKTIRTDINLLSFEDEFISKVDENTFIDLLKLNKKDKNEYENIFKAYKSISAVFEKNRLFNYAGEYYYLAKCAERKSLKGLEKVKSNIFYYSCGYGERPTFALISSLEIVLIFSIIYMFSGLCVNERIIHYNLNILSYLPRKLMYMDLIDCFYFSLVTFTTVGYGDIFPIGYSVLFSCVEMLLGVTMVGVWTATLARKITR